MESGLYLYTLIGTALVLAAAFSSLAAFRFGAPLLLVFLGIGLAAGEDGLGIAFNNAPAAFALGSLALAVILFDSGFGTPQACFRQAAMPAAALATLGVVLTAGLLALPAHYLVGMGWTESLLLGALVASTDAAAVFFLLHAGNFNIRERVRSVLEIESGGNDPIAIYLVLALTGYASAATQAAPGALALDIAMGFAAHMAIGGLAGLFGGWLITALVERLPLDHGLLPVFVLTLAMLIFGAAGLAHGSGFLAVYMAGVMAGNSGMRSAAFIKRFKNGMSWLAQIVMFVMLGLFATPSEFAAVALPAVGLAVALTLFARPVAAVICLAPFGFSLRETAFISWVGLRGAVSILLALAPLIAGLDAGRMLFNMVFIIVMVSLALQGWTIGPMARRLGLIVPPRSGVLEKFELELPGSAHHELLSYRVAPASPVARGAALPAWARPSLVVRGGNSMKMREAGALVTGDLVYLFVPDTYPRLLDRLFAGRASISRDDEDFFGAFAIDPAQPAADLDAAYNLGLEGLEKACSIAELMAHRLGGLPLYADRVAIGSVELIVRDVDDDGRILAAGLSFEPRPAPRLTPGSALVLRLRSRLASVFGRSRRN